MMLADNTDSNDDNTESPTLLLEVSDDNSCTFEYIEVVPLSRDTDGTSTTECDSGDWSAQVRQDLPVVKQEPDDVCSARFY